MRVSSSRFYVKFSPFLLFFGLFLFLFVSCTGWQIRKPSPSEKRYYVLSENLDMAIIDPLEKGPLNSLSGLASGGDDPRSSFLKYFQRQKELIQKDIVRVGYDDGMDEGNSSGISGEEKASSAIIATVIIVLVLAGVALPLLFALDVI